jgi:hypothetical protein
MRRMRDPKPGRTRTPRVRRIERRDGAARRAIVMNDIARGPGLARALDAFTEARSRSTSPASFGRGSSNASVVWPCAVNRPAACRHLTA